MNNLNSKIATVVVSIVVTLLLVSVFQFATSSNENISKEMSQDTPKLIVNDRLERRRSFKIVTDLEAISYRQSNEGVREVVLPILSHWNEIQHKSTQIKMNLLEMKCRDRMDIINDVNSEYNLQKEKMLEYFLN